MNTRNILIAAGVLLFFTAIVLFIRNMLNPGGLFGSGATAVLADQKIKLEVAKTSREQQIGLSEHTSLADDRGMIFLYDKPDYYSFWMRNMKFPIDIIFLNGETIVTVHKNVQPPKSETDGLPLYTSDEPANRVLELKAGKADEFDLKKGDKIPLAL